jgi:hypothetical protein
MRDMSEIIRDLIARTQPGSLPAAFVVEVPDQPDLPQPVRARCGTARITANSGGGAYTITETARVGGVLTALTAPDGFVGRTAYAVDDSDLWEVGDDVFYIQVPTDAAAGTFTTYIERGPEEPGPATLDTTVGFCGLLNYRVDARGRIVASQVSTGGSPATKWVDNEGHDL